MSARNLTESTIIMLRDYLKKNIPTALASIRVDRGDQKVTTEPPKDYFIFEGAHTYKTPAVFLIADQGDLDKDRGQNAIMALIKVRISVVIEDFKQDLLTIKAWRYQDALYETLDQAQLLSDDKSIKLIVVVRDFAYSPIFMDTVNKQDAKNAFRKEVVMNCDVRHFEKP